MHPCYITDLAVPTVPGFLCRYSQRTNQAIPYPKILAAILKSLLSFFQAKELQYFLAYDAILNKKGIFFSFLITLSSPQLRGLSKKY